MVNGDRASIVGRGQKYSAMRQLEYDQAQSGHVLASSSACMIGCMRANNHEWARAVNGRERAGW